MAGSKTRLPYANGRLKLLHVMVEYNCTLWPNFHTNVHIIAQHCAVQPFRIPGAASEEERRATHSTTSAARCVQYV